MGSGSSIKPEIFTLAKEEYEAKKKSQESSGIALSDEDLFNYLAKFIEEKTAELEAAASTKKDEDVIVKAVVVDSVENIPITVATVEST
eukprot:gene11198-15019_t